MMTDVIIGVVGIIAAFLAILWCVRGLVVLYRKRGEGVKRSDILYYIFWTAYYILMIYLIGRMMVWRGGRI